MLKVTLDDLKNVMIPDSMTSIGNSAFSNCTKLTKFKQHYILDAID